MDLAGMFAQLACGGAALRSAAVDLDAAVPACPGWTVRDVVEHTAVVYAHKSVVVEGALPGPPSPWPPEFPYDDLLEFYDEQLHRVIEALRSRHPQTSVWTWYQPEQNVRFWVRRMMHETVIHRADVESARGAPSPIDADVAVDGIDELLVRMLAYDTVGYAEAGGNGERLVITAGDCAWTVTLRPDAATVTTGAATDADAAIDGDPSDVLLALWNRLPYDVAQTRGDSGALARLREAIAATTK